MDIDLKNFTNLNFTTFNMTTGASYALPLTFKTVILSLYALTATVSIFGNTVVLLTIYKMPKKRETINNYFVVSFAISDILMSSVCIPFTCISSILYSWWPFGATLCPIISYLQISIVLQRSFSMVAVSFERHQAIAYRLQQPMRKRTVKLVIVIIWIFALVIAVPTALYSKIVYLSFEPGNNGLCIEAWTSAEIKTMYSCIILLLQYGAPFVMMGVMYSHIGYIIWTNKTPGESDKKRDQRIAKTKKKSVKMLAALVSVFIITWLPLHILTIIGDVEPSIYDDMNIHMMWLAFHWVALSNSGTGCVILISMSATYRDEFKFVVSKVTRGRCLEKSGSFRKSSNDSLIIDRNRSFSLGLTSQQRRTSVVSMVQFRIKPAQKRSSL